MLKIIGAPANQFTAYTTNQGRSVGGPVGQIGGESYKVRKKFGREKKTNIMPS